MTALLANLMRDTAFRERLFRAWMLLQVQKGRSVKQDWLAGEVSRRLQLATPLSQSAVSRWFRGSEPDLATIRAIAAVLGVDPGWLAFGEASQAPEPEDPFRARVLPMPRPPEGR